VIIIKNKIGEVISKRREIEQAAREYGNSIRQARDEEAEDGRKASKMYIRVGRDMMLPPGASLLEAPEIMFLVQLHHLLRIVNRHIPRVVTAYQHRLEMLLDFFSPRGAQVAQQMINQTAERYERVDMPYPNANMLLREDGTTEDDPIYYEDEHTVGANTTFIEGIALAQPYDIEPGEERARLDLRIAYLRHQVRNLGDQIVNVQRRLLNPNAERRDDIPQEHLQYDIAGWEEDLQNLQSEIERATAEIAELEPRIRDEEVPWMDYGAFAPESRVLRAEAPGGAAPGGAAPTEEDEAPKPEPPKPEPPQTEEEEEEPEAPKPEAPKPETPKIEEEEEEDEEEQVRVEKPKPTTPPVITKSFKEPKHKHKKRGKHKWKRK
jgi:hypothetical protein